MITKERYIICFSMLIYFILMWFCFNLVTAEFINVPGYDGLSLSGSDYLVSAILVFVFSFFIPSCYDRASNFVVWVVFYFHIVPFVLFFRAATELSFLFFLSFSIVVLLLYALLSRLINYVPVLGGFNLSFRTVSFLLIFAIFSSFSVFYNDFGFNLSPPSFFDVYEVREFYIENVSMLGGYSAILNGFMFSPLSVLLSLFFYIKGRYFLSILFFFIAFILSYQVYSSAGFKSVALMFMVVLAFAVLMRLFWKNGFGSLVSVILVFILFVGFFLSLAFSFDDLLLHWARRTLIVPGVNASYFIEYEYLYSFEAGASAPNVISKFYYNTDGSANSGLIGDGVFKYGIYFFWINILVFFIFLSSIEFFLGKNSRLLAAVFFPSAYALANSTIASVLLTYGLAPMILFAYLFKRFFKNV